MKTKLTRFLSKPLLIVGVTFVSVTVMPAQMQLKLKDKSNVVTDVSLTSIKKLTFPAGTSLSIDKGFAGQQSFALSNISKIFFGTSITSNQTLLGNDKLTHLYPIPAKDQITLDLNVGEAAMASIGILDFNGRVLSSQISSVIQGENSFSLNCSILNTWPVYM